MVGTPRIFISHAAPDLELGSRVAEFLRAAAGAQLGSSAQVGGGEDLAGLQQQLAQAEVVIGVITSGALDSGEVAFQLGAAWALGKRLVLLLRPDEGARETALPAAEAEVLVLGADALIELAASLGGHAGGALSLSPEARAALGALFPDYRDRDATASTPGLIPAPALRGGASIPAPALRGGASIPAEATSSTSTTQQQWPLDENGVQRPSSPPADPAVAAASSISSIVNAPPRSAGAGVQAVAAGLARPGLPSRDASLRAGRAVSDCLFNRDQGGPFAPELDAPFGAFLAALDGNWNTLRKLEDLDVWLEVADNLLDSLLPSEEHVRFWYEVGFQLATLINLSGRELGGATPDTEFADLWRGSLEALRISGRNAGLEDRALSEVLGMLENLRGPAEQRDYSNLGRVQARMREHAGRQDAAQLAVVA